MRTPVKVLLQQRYLLLRKHFIKQHRVSKKNGVKCMLKMNDVKKWSLAGQKKTHYGN